MGRSVGSRPPGAAVPAGFPLSLPGPCQLPPPGERTLPRTVGALELRGRARGPGASCAASCAGGPPGLGTEPWERLLTPPGQVRACRAARSNRSVCWDTRREPRPQVLTDSLGLPRNGPATRDIVPLPRGGNGPSTGDAGGPGAARRSFARGWQGPGGTARTLVCGEGRRVIALFLSLPSFTLLPLSQPPSTMDTQGARYGPP